MPNSATPWTVARQAPLVHEVFQARRLEWVVIFLLEGIFPTQVSCIGRWILYHLHHLGCLKTSWEQIWAEHLPPTKKKKKNLVPMRKATSLATDVTRRMTRRNSWARPPPCWPTLVPLSWAKWGKLICHSNSLSRDESAFIPNLYNLELVWRPHMLTKGHSHPGRHQSQTGPALGERPICQ